ncbi:hypothetical protein ACUWCL_28575, partial [Klebsiella pneumoniae]|uniref:hypothetical protein n=1 Tax=Klebsiella pneumoniae TaxID=573 RepID=UPI004055683A
MSEDMSDLTKLCDVAISTAGDLAHTCPCLHCGITFRRRYPLDSHFSIHRTTCKHFNRSFPDKASPETHERGLWAESTPTQQTEDKPPTVINESFLKNCV